MKDYNYDEAVETLRGLFAIQDKQLLAKELAKIMVTHVGETLHGWTIKDIDLKLIFRYDNTFGIKIGNEE